MVSKFYCVVVLLHRAMVTGHFLLALWSLVRVLVPALLVRSMMARDLEGRPEWEERKRAERELEANVRGGPRRAFQSAFLHPNPCAIETTRRWTH